MPPSKPHKPESTAMRSRTDPQPPTVFEAFRGVEASSSFNLFASFRNHALRECNLSLLPSGFEQAPVHLSLKPWAWAQACPVLPMLRA